MPKAKPNPEQQSLRDEIKRLQEEIEILRQDKVILEWRNRRLQKTLSIWGIFPGDPEEKKALWEALKETADLYSYPGWILTRAYNCLIRSGITSFSQLRNLIAIFGEEEIVKRVRNLGKKSFQLIKLALEKEHEADEKALKEAVDTVVAPFPSILQWRIRTALKQAKVTLLSKLQELTEEEIKEIGARLGREDGEKFLYKILEAAEKAPS